MQRKSKIEDVALSVVVHLPAKLIYEGDIFLMETGKKAKKLYWYYCLYSTGIQR